MTILRWQIICPAMFACCATAAAESWRVNVVDDSSGAGVNSALVRVEGNGSEKQIAENDRGVFKLPANCHSGQRLVARPKTSAYNPNGCDCPLQEDPTRITVTSVSVMTSLENIARNLESMKKWADAALLYNEIWYRTRGADPKMAGEARAKTIRYFGNVLGVKDPVKFVSTGGAGMTAEATESMVNSVRDYQMKMGVKSTGAINHVTLVRAAGKDVGDLVPGVASAAREPDTVSKHF